MKKSIGIIVFLGFILWATKSYAPSIGGSSIGSQVTLVGVPEVSASTVTGNTIYEGGEALSNKYITSIGDVTSGAAFDGTQGTTFTFFNAGGNATLDYDGTDFSFSKLISTPNYISTVAIGTQPYAATSTTLNTNLNADLLDGESASAFQDTDAGLTSLAGLTYASTSFVKMTGADTFSLDTNTYLTSVTAHNLLSATHGDTAAASPVLGDIMYGNVTPAWTKLAGNTTTTRNFLRQTGTGAVSAVPAWDTVTATDVGLGNVTNESKATMFTSPTFTGTPVIPTPFTLGAVSVLPTGTELNYVDGVTSGIQAQLDGKEPTLTKYNLAGTTNQITLSASGAGAILANNITLSLPQDIATSSSPQFANLIITAGGDIKPSANSTTAINIAQADGTNFVSFDTTNKQVLVGSNPDPSATYPFDVYKASTTTGLQTIANFGVGSDGSPAAGEGSSITFGIPYTTSAGVQVSAGYIGLVRPDATATNYGGEMVFGTRTHGSATAERMRIDTNGNVGIGTTTPGALLHVGNSATAGESVFRIGAGGVSEVPVIQLKTPDANYSWVVAAQKNVNNGLEFTPSTAVGGTTFTTPVLTLLQNGDIFSTAWTDYSATSTIVGWSSFTTKKIFYKKIGRLVFVAYDLEGTSNSTTTSFTLPVSSAAINFYGISGYNIDNGVVLTVAGRLNLDASSTTLTVLTNMASAGWTASGSKRTIGNFWYEASS